MAIACYMAMTAAEFFTCTNLPTHIGWLACHFSSSGPGLSNIPKVLPPDSLLMIDDSTPFECHQSDLILEQVQELIVTMKISAVILDFQRSGNPAVKELVSFLQTNLPCPVAAPPLYASEDFPVFLPPCPLNLPLEKHLAPFNGRAIWLDATPLALEITVTEQGSAYQTLPGHAPDHMRHWDSTLRCNYSITADTNRIIFTLGRDDRAFQKWLEKAEELGVSGVVGLYQEWK